MLAFEQLHFRLIYYTRFFTYTQMHINEMSNLPQILNRNNYINFTKEEVTNTIFYFIKYEYISCTFTLFK